MEKLCISKSVEIEEFTDGEIAVYDSDNEIIHIFNETAARILKLLMLDSVDVAREQFINSVLLSNNSITVDELSRDFQAIVDELTEKKIFEHGNAADIA